MNRIKELRIKSKLTQIELAKKLNTTQANLSGWENQKWQPDQKTLIAMSNVFGVSVDYILCNNSSTSAHEVLDNDFVILQRAYNKMDKNKQQKLKAMLELTFDIAFGEGNSEDDKK